MAERNLETLRLARTALQRSYTLVEDLHRMKNADSGAQAVAIEVGKDIMRALGAIKDEAPELWIDGAH